MRRSQQQQGSDPSPHFFPSPKADRFRSALSARAGPESSLLNSAAECKEVHSSKVPAAVHILPVRKSGQVLVRTLCQDSDRKPSFLDFAAQCAEANRSRGSECSQILPVRKSGQVLVRTYVLKYASFPKVLGVCQEF